MRPLRVLCVIVVTPGALFAPPARAFDELEPYRSIDPIQDSFLETWLDTNDTRSENESRVWGPVVGRGHALVSIDPFWKQTATGRNDFGVMLMLGMPLDRVARQSGSRAATAPAIAEEVHDEEPEGSLKPTRPAPGVLAPSTVPAQLSPSLAQACVKAAWRAHGWAGEGDLDGMGARARLSATLPEVRLRASRGWDQSFRVLPTDTDPYRTQEITGVSRWIEGRLTWKLDRILFVDEEIPIERLRLKRIEARSRLAGRVLSALFDWYRSMAAASDPIASTQEHVEAVLRKAEAEAMLDVLTGGWFSQWLADRH